MKPNINRTMRHSLCVVCAMAVSVLSLAGCGAIRTPLNEFKVGTSTVCIDGYLYAYWSISDYTFDMEPTGQFCEVTDDAA